MGRRVVPVDRHPPRNDLGRGVRRLLGLFFSLSNRFFVLLLILLDLSFGLIGRDILRLRQSISSLVGCSILLRWVSGECGTNSSCCSILQCCRILPARSAPDLTLDGSHWIGHIVQRWRSALNCGLEGSTEGLAGPSEHGGCRA